MSFSYFFVFNEYVLFQTRKRHGNTGHSPRRNGKKNIGRSTLIDMHMPPSCIHITSKIYSLPPSVPLLPFSVTVGQIARTSCKASQGKERQRKASSSTPPVLLLPRSTSSYATFSNRPARVAISLFRCYSPRTKAL